MSNLDLSGQRLLAVLVKHLAKVEPGNPDTYIGYREIHMLLGIGLEGPTWGDSLKHQGLISLAYWTIEEGKPAITGIIIDRNTLMPGQGYFRLFGKDETDFGWWENQVRLSKEFDWFPFLP